MLKYKLYASKSGWEGRHTSLMAHLDIPNETSSARAYAVISQVDNSEHVDFGKYVMPVRMDTKWKVGDQFNESDLVDCDKDWFVALTDGRD